MTDQETPAKRRTWVGEWMRSEAFWRDVASRALAGLIVLAVGAVGAALAGLVDLWLVLRLLLAFSGMLGVAAFWVYGSSRIGHYFTRLEARLREEGKSTRGVGVLFALTLILSALASWALVSGLGWLATL